MKVKLNKLFCWSIILTIISTQGLLIFIVFKILGNWEFKKFIHPLSFFIIFILFIFKSIKKITITLLDVLFTLYFLGLFLVLLLNNDGFQSLYITFREIYLLFILVFIFQKLELNEKEWLKILNLLFYLLILNTLFIALTYILGPENYMKLLTGRYQWGVDEEYGFKITNFSKFWRTPALIGNPASLGYFSALTYLLMDQNEKFKKKKYFALIPLFLSFVRSAYLIFIVYEFFKFFTKKKNLKKVFTILKVGIPILLITALLLAKNKVLSTASLYARLHLWSTEINVNYNIFFGGAIGNVGGGARNVGGFIETVDSYWFYLLLSSGFTGIIMVILFMYEKSKKNNKFLFILIAFFIAGFFVNLTQSIVFLAIFPLLFVKIKKEEVIHNLEK
tara:strand:- start:334 stop:1506 length:1173 start_codon:yes stop_codon:yes gene_type:complete